MKRNVAQKPNQGPVKVRNRAEAKTKSTKFIEDCEQSLIRLIEQESKKPGIRWSNIYQTFENKVSQLLETYHDRKGYIILASNNVRKALHKLIESSF